jgi:hypothetical protein
MVLLPTAMKSFSLFLGLFLAFEVKGWAQQLNYKGTADFKMIVTLKKYI